MISRKFIASVALAATAVLSACATYDVSRTIPFDEDFQGEDFNWSSNVPGHTGGSTIFYFKPINVNGMLEVCGVWTHVGDAGREHARKIMEGLVMISNGQRVLSSFTYFTKAKAPSDFASTPANCAATGVAYPTDLSDLHLDYRGRSRFTVH